MIVKTKMQLKKELKRVKVLVTNGCNLNCSHCFRDKSNEVLFLPKSKLKEIVDFSVDNNCCEMSFSGGEFFTHPDSYWLIEYCLSKKIHISILTNAIDIDIDFFKKIEDKSSVSFQVSIDGNMEAHDFRRGSGSYQKTINNIIQLFKLGYKLTAKTVLDENNYKQFISVVELPWFEDVLVLPVAIFDEKNDNKNVINKEYEQVIQIIYKKFFSSNKIFRTCNAYPEEIAIRYDGNVYPCTEAREHDLYSMGNITQKTLYELIREYESSDNDKLHCSDITVSECEKCKFINICNKGCRLRAYRYYGRLNASDPFNCRIFNDANLEIPIGKLFWGRKQ